MAKIAFLGLGQVGAPMPLKDVVLSGEHSVVRALGN